MIHTGDKVAGIVEIQSIEPLKVCDSEFLLASEHQSSPVITMCEHIAGIQPQTTMQIFHRLTGSTCILKRNCVGGEAVWISWIKPQCFFGRL